MEKTANSTIKLLLFLILILFIVPRSTVAQLFGPLQSNYEPRSPFSEWQKLLKELQLNPSSEKIKDEIKEIREIMLIPLTPENVKGDLTLNLETHNNFFSTATFPKEGIVSNNKASVYNNLLLKTKELSKGTRIKLAGVYPFAFRNDDSATGIYHYFYRIRTDTTEIISTNDVAIEETVINPPYISPNKKVKVLKTPVTYFYAGEAFYTQGKYKLWLETEDGRLIFLNDYYLTISEDISDHLQSSYKYEHPISWSPDGRYLFIECVGKVFSPNGKLIFYNKKHYTSPFWHGGYLYIRGVEEDDNVYKLNLETLELKKFIEYSQGRKLISDMPYDRNKECRMISKPIRLENGNFIVNFYRENPKSTDLDDGCMEIKITADKTGAIIKKDTLIRSCIESYVESY